MKIQWNKVTWYSWALTAIIFLIIIPFLTFYFIGQYKEINNLSQTSASTASISSQSSGLSTYNNFGITFQYPETFGLPHESFYGALGQQSIVFDAMNASDTQPLMVYTMQDTNPFNGTPENETFDQMIARFQTNDSQIYLVKDIMVNGIVGKELFYNSAITGEPYHADAYFQIQNGWYVVFAADFQSVPQDIFDSIISTFNFNSSSVAEKDSATGMFVYANNGIQFEYPGEFSTNYASLDIQTSVEKISSSTLDANGCHPIIGVSGRVSSPSILVINNTQFCYSTGGGVGAGQEYITNQYTTSRNGLIYEIDYVVNSSNGCGVYENSPDINDPGNEKYKECLAFQQNYSNLVTKPIQESISTFEFMQQ